MATLDAITIYPVKSCAGINLEQCRVRAYGLEFDRRWMVTDLAGRFLSQREYPALARVITTQNHDVVELNARGMDNLALSTSDTSYYSKTIATLWADSLHVHIVSEHANRWFSDYLGLPVRLVRYDERLRRKVDQRWTGSSIATTQFADGFPFLITAQSSLDELNSRLSLKGVAPLPMNRFRPNLVLSGLDPYDEDRIEMLFIGAPPNQVQLKLVKKCARCSIPTVDQVTGLKDPKWPNEPLVTLAEYRFDSNVRGFTFGQNAIILRGQNETLFRGQEVQCHFI